MTSAISTANLTSRPRADRQASRALDAHGAGSREPAQALSVLIVEALITEFALDALPTTSTQTP
jgi:hypothetical protein